MPIARFRPFWRRAEAAHSCDCLVYGAASLAAATDVPFDNQSFSSDACDQIESAVNVFPFEDVPTELLVNMIIFLDGISQHVSRRCVK